jgi:2-dehydro-3-deoxygluconokinase
LQKKLGFRLVATTLREGFSATENRWTGLLTDGKDFSMSDSYLMQVVDRVGGGDGFSGALIYALLQDMGRQRAISFAAAASCLKHSMHGDFNHATIGEVETLMNGGGGGRIQR